METTFPEALGPELAQALADKGFTQLTAVQQAVLEPELEGRDLRVTSQTGSGKTVAIGFALRGLVGEECVTEARIARPKALVVAPTRELALQVESELKWLYAHARGRVASVTGGASYRDERRALAKGPAVVVGTPGRLLDHLRRGMIDPAAVTAVVLDEADRMLELGFREDLEAILALVPEGRTTHLVSATFPRAVRALADSVQNNPMHVEGTRLGAANADIDHVVHLIDPRQKLDSIVNLLLRYPDEQTLIFARTRIEVAELATALAAAGFAAASLSGEMDQTARNRALAAFKRGTLKVLVATEVAARGIDVQDITRVIHAELPTNADSYTHRSGRTGRAGRKGTSALLVSPAGVVHATRLLRSANVQHRFEPIPTAEEIRQAADERVIAELTSEEAEPATPLDAAARARLHALAERLLQTGDPARTVARLLARTDHSTIAQARDVKPISAPRLKHERGHDRDRGRDHDRDRDRGPAR
ncbi:MAG TPA: DEAD/DEAH box helicase, partial [Polyangiales bacterium]|nr:DEAD/DEAH box helicase [Polyangiales bacterium]